MSTSGVRYAQLHTLGLVLSIPLLAINLISREDNALTVLAYLMISACYFFVAVSKSDNQVMALVVSRGLPRRIARLVFATLAVFIFAVPACYPVERNLQIYPMMACFLVAIAIYFWALWLALFWELEVGSDVTSQIAETDAPN